MERLLDGTDDLLAEFGVVAAGFGFEFNTIGDDVGRSAAVDVADVAGAAAAASDDLPVPAFIVQPGDGQGRDADGADSELWGDAGVAGQAFDFDFHPIAAGGADGYFFSGAPVPVKGEFWIAQELHVSMPHSVQANFLLDGPEER